MWECSKRHTISNQSCITGEFNALEELLSRLFCCSKFAFAKSKGETTIVPKLDAPGMGQRDCKWKAKFTRHRCFIVALSLDMTKGDIIRLNRMYRCPNFETKSLTKPERKHPPGRTNSSFIEKL